MIYDDIYKTEETYNLPSPDKLTEVYNWAKDFKTLLDIGCGRGHYLRYLRKKGLFVTGVEPSEYIAQTLDNVINSTIIDFTPKRRYEALYCMDVLEHILEQEMPENVAKLAQLTPRALIGVANHSDIWNGKELHLTQQDSNWWMDTLSGSYRSVELIKEEERFYLFSCSR